MLSGRAPNAKCQSRRFFQRPNRGFRAALVRTETPLGLLG